MRIYIIISSLIFSIFGTSCTKEEIVKTKYIPRVDNYTAYQLDMLNQLNALRAENNLQLFTPEIMLTECAKSHAQYMNRIHDINHDYFWSRFIQSQSTRFGEVCAYNFQDATSEVTAFENSPNHFNVLTNPHYIYCGIYKEGEYLCIDFASYEPLINKNTNIFK